ncbi:hypothetical protein [Neopusillimonas aromaticivorans]|uniref:hypothetical protein n=1 Tax=Neopusillimonas aromaticivorans TaxID=2979868 RepID=UPI00259A5452|nr:hypothetical protein [Neopusillimonas aromaticivorans]WJJ93868.1 hypothetical protein N7E01_01025 [Neopusillimonas aromaticivorans]
MIISMAINAAIRRNTTPCHTLRPAIRLAQLPTRQGDGNPVQRLQNDMHARHAMHRYTFSHGVTNPFPGVQLLSQ